MRLIVALRSRLGPYAQILLIFLASRLMLTVIGVLTLANFGDTPTQDHWLNWERLLHLCVRWDSDWYLSIIDSGYSRTELAEQSGATNFAFFPLYPLLVIATQKMWGVSAITAGVLVSNLAFIAALLLIFEYVQAIGLSHRVGIMTVLLLCFVPQGFIFSALYTESTFLLLLVAAMYALRHQFYLVSGLCAALLSATRANGVFFMVFAAIWLLRQHGLRSLLYPWRHP